MKPKRKREPAYEERPTMPGRMECQTCHRNILYYILNGRCYLSFHINQHSDDPYAICPGTDRDMGKVEDA